MVDIVGSQWPVISVQWPENSRLRTSQRPLTTGHLFLVPADGGFVQVDVNLLGLQVFFNTPRAEFATETRLLVASPWRFNVGWLHVVDPDDSGAQGLHGAHRPENISRPDGGGEAVR